MKTAETSVGLSPVRLSNARAISLRFCKEGSTNRRKPAPSISVQVQMAERTALASLSPQYRLRDKFPRVTTAQRWTLPSCLPLAGGCSGPKCGAGLAPATKATHDAAAHARNSARLNGMAPSAARRNSLCPEAALRCSRQVSFEVLGNISEVQVSLLDCS